MNMACLPLQLTYMVALRKWLKIVSYAPTDFQVYFTAIINYDLHLHPSSSSYRLALIADLSF